MKESYKLEIMAFAKAICDHYEIKIEDLQSKRRFRKLVQPRQIIWSMARDIYGARITLAALGHMFGGKDHATVLAASKAVKNDRDTDKGFNLRYEQFLQEAKDRINARPLKTQDNTLAGRLREMMAYQDIINLKIGMRQLIAELSN